MTPDVSLEPDRRALPDGPAELTRDDYKTALKATLAEIKADDVPSLAAGVAFKIFLSLFPSLIAAVAVFSLVTTPADMDRFLGVIQGLDVIPAAASDLLTAPLESLVEGGGGAAGAAAIAGVLGGLWAATSAAVTLIKALSRAWDVPETRNFFAQRGVALVMTLVLFVALIGLFVLVVVGMQIQEALLPAAFSRGVMGSLLGLARFVGALILLVALFAFVYWVGPDRTRPDLAWLSPGAVTGVVGWLLVSGAFTLYVRVAGNYEATYGALAGVIVLLLWLQITMMILLVGAELNAEVEKVAATKAAVVEGAGFALAAPLAEAASDAPDGGTELRLPPVDPSASVRPLAGLEQRAAMATSKGSPGVATRVGAALATVGALAAVVRRRRRGR